MEGQDSARFPARIQNLLFFFILFGIGLLVFLPVRNNGFWQPADWEYMIQSLRIEKDWLAVFNAAPYETFQPVVNFIFFLEFELFELSAYPYYVVNILVHAINAWLVFILVRILLRDRTIAILSGLLFVFAVGNYGKAVMVVSGISDLVITMLTMLTMIFYVRNELYDRGRLWTANFVACVFFFALTLLSKATSFSLLGVMLAFNLFFRDQTGRRVFDRNFVFIAVFALLVLATKLTVLRTIPGAADMTIVAVPRNFASYLVRMVFPIQSSILLRDQPPVVRFFYEFASQIRMLTFFCIVSYSVFGFIFGNKVIRFFIAWTYIMVTPFCFFNFPADWLNVRYLYLVSVGFCMILASGTALAGRLLYQRPWRRRLPYLIPLVFVLIAQAVIHNLDRNYERLAESPRLDSVKGQFYVAYQRALEHRLERRSDGQD